MSGKMTGDLSSTHSISVSTKLEMVSAVLPFMRGHVYDDVKKIGDV